MIKVIEILKLDSHRQSLSACSPLSNSNSQHAAGNVWVNEQSHHDSQLPLHIAASRGYLDLVMLLVDKAGAIVDLPDKEREVINS